MRNKLLHTLTLSFSYRKYEQAFAQPNAPVNEMMLNWAAEQTAGSSGDLLELYCGNGNFTLPLARQFQAVLATELSKTATRAAKENIAANGTDNVAVVRLSAEEVSAALRGVRRFRRLAATLSCVRGFPRIVYVSCNPATLRDNLAALHSTHRVTAFALFDQFPYTPHMECGVVACRR